MFFCTQSPGANVPYMIIVIIYFASVVYVIMYGSFYVIVYTVVSKNILYHRSSYIKCHFIYSRTCHHTIINEIISSGSI